MYLYIIYINTVFWQAKSSLHAWNINRFTTDVTDLPFALGFCPMPPFFLPCTQHTLKALSNWVYLFNNKTFVYMFPIAGQTAGPIGLKFFVDTQGWPGGDIG